MSDPAANPVRDAILAIAVARGAGKTLCPTDAAKAVSAADWRRLLPGVRAEAVRLALEGRVVIYRKGRSVDPETFKGVYRIGLPAPDRKHGEGA